MQRSCIPTAVPHLHHLHFIRRPLSFQGLPQAHARVRVHNRGYHAPVTTNGAQSNPITSEDIPSPNHNSCGGLIGDGPDSNFTLSSLDFPHGWVNGAHPDDFHLLPEPLEPEWLWNQNQNRARMWFRISFKVEGGFLPASFLVSTGAPSWFWFNFKLLAHLSNQGHGRIVNPGVVEIAGPEPESKSANARAYFTPYNHQPANVIGVELIRYLVIQDSVLGQN